MALVLRHNGAPLSGAIFAKNPRKLRLNRKRRAMRRNPADLGSLPVVGGTVSSVTNTAQTYLRKIPVVGDTLANSLPTILLGVGVSALSYGAMKLANMYAPSWVSRMAPVAGTTVGLVTAVALQKLPYIKNVGSETLRNQVSAGVVLLGAAYDFTRYMKGTSRVLSGIDDVGDLDIGDVDGLAMGDGMAYDVVPLGDTDGLAMSGAEYQLASAYADAELGDAELCGNDFSEVEGSALLGDSYLATFGAPPDLRTRIRGRHSRHAGKEGHRWAWLIKLVGPKRAKKIAEMDPEARVQLIKQLREQAIQTVSGGAGGGSTEDIQGLAMSGLAMSGLAMSGLGSDYGNLFAGSAY